MNIQNRKITDHFLLGINYWPSSSALNMWTEWNPKELADDADRIKRLGMNCCRFFLYMPAFMDMEDRVNQIMLERLKFFMSLYEEREIFTLPTFIVGHMSGEDWDVPWRKGADFISDSRIIKATELYITTVVKEIKNFSGVFGWLLSNELPNDIGNQSPEAVSRWVERIISAIKKIDPDRPVSIGDGAWCPEIIGQQTGFHLRKLNRFQDFVGLHFYPRGMNPWHHSYTTAFRTQLAKVWGKPVIVEEFGTSTTLCSEANQAHYYRSVFYSALINGAEGVLGWCLNDFNFLEKRPYSHHPFEERFGVVRADKTLKPAAYEFNKFKEISTGLANQGFQKVNQSVGLFISSDYYYAYPYQFEPAFKDLYGFYLESFTLLKRANLDVKMIVEPAQEIENGGRYTHNLQMTPEEIPLLIIPRMKYMTKRTRLMLNDYLQNGGTIYFSFANDSWVLDWDHLAGIKMNCRFGVPDFRNVASLNIVAKQEWGQFNKGETFILPLDNTSPEHSYCSICETIGKVILEDQFGSPFLIENQVGRGKVYFTPYPVEMLSFITPDDNSKFNISRIYRSIYKEICKQASIEVEGNGLESGIWLNGTQYRIIILNHSWEEQDGYIRFENSFYTIELTDLALRKVKQNVYQIHLPEKGVGYLIVNRVTKTKTTQTKEEK